MSGKDGNGVQRGDVFVLRASAARRWWARVFDGMFIVAAAAVVFAVAAVLADTGRVSDDVMVAALVFGYPVLLLIFGALYGCSSSPGQALLGVVSLRCHSGRRVGFWRGMCRYVSVGFFPITALIAILSILELPTSFYDEEIRVYRR